MLVYRICLAKWSSELKASGLPARWNSKGKYVIYSAENRSLACLENLVHRSGLGDNKLYKILVISIPDDIKINDVTQKQLSKNWREYSNYSLCQKIGDEWIDNLTSCLLRIPSSLIPQEYNYLINPKHKEFTRIKISSKEDFNFDKRLYSI
ncbi:MAG TPA: RES family NAD+ phosphorylase [Ignavibacteriaceae bacterium]|nr:RES family NAD+ phosphorylase [Ignavibacteriaceae bacterium]